MYLLHIGPFLHRSDYDNGILQATDDDVIHVTWNTFRITGPLWGESTTDSPHKGPEMLNGGTFVVDSLN